MEKHVDGVHFFNLGSVSNPIIGDQKACYALLEANEDGYNIRHRYVAYDNQAVIEAIKETSHPMAEYIIDYQLGNIKPPWQP
jgi:hypothetical protein